MQRDSIDFGTMDVGKLFRKQLIPTVLGMVFSALFVITDGIFVGRGVIFLIRYSPRIRLQLPKWIYLVFNAIIQSAQPIISYNYGTGAIRRSQQAFRLSMYTTVLTSIEKSRPATIFTMMRGVILPVICFFVLPLYLGVKGIWLSVASAELITLLAIVFNFVRQRARHLASDRYQALVERIPNFLQEVSLKEIASFLGVTPQSLSRIRVRGSKRNNQYKEYQQSHENQNSFACIPAYGHCHTHIGSK